MPELPEVETSRRGISPHLVAHTVRDVQVRQWRLRWPVPPELPRLLPGQTLEALERRAKYLIFTFPRGRLLLHLGMSGSLRMVDPDTPPGKHDHLDLRFDNDRVLRLRDPRRFGAALWTAAAPGAHPLLRELGPEPLGEDFTGDYLFRRSRGRRVAVKQFIMDSHTVVGVGNIYAAEALFDAGIRPGRAAGRLTRAEYRRLAAAIDRVLRQAIDAGGTTLRDFTGGSGDPGYFRQALSVYGRTGQPCIRCGTALKHKRLGQRATVYCARCQR